MKDNTKDSKKVAAMPAMSCDRLRDLLPDYLAGALLADENLHIQTHLASCTSCGLEVATLERTWEDMALLADEMPSEALRTSFYARLHQAERDLQRVPLGERLNRLFAALWPERPALQFATALALLVLGVAIGSRLRPAAPAVTVAAAPTAVVPTAPALSQAVTPPAPNAAPTATAGLTMPAAVESRGDEVHALRDEVRSLSHLVALSLLRNDSAADRLQGVSYSREASASDPRVLAALLEAANRDPNDNVRLAAIDALKPLLGRHDVRERLLDGFDEQRSPLVQIALVDAVAAGSGHDAAPALRSLLARPNLDPTVRQRVQANLGDRS